MSAPIQEKLVTHYDNLKVAQDAPLPVIKAAYRALVQMFHPDKFPDQMLAEHRIKIIIRAYDVLSDVEKRRQHDAWIEEQKEMRAAADSLYAAVGARAGFANQYAWMQAETDAAPEQAKPRTQSVPQTAAGLPGKIRRVIKLAERIALVSAAVLLAYVFVVERISAHSPK